MIVEQKHKHLLETSRALLFHSNIPLVYWGDCVLTVSYLINYFPSKLLNDISPYEELFGTKPNYSHHSSFGCFCYMTVPRHHRDKFSPRASPCIFLDYPFGKKAYKVLDLHTN